MLILASKSPRRHQLLCDAGIDCTVLSSSFEEKIDNAIDPRDLCIELAYGKAFDVYKSKRERLDEKDIILGADTIVVFGGVVFGKPTDEAEANKFLHMLSGNTHEVLTGLVLIRVGDGQILKHVESTLVTFRELSKTEIAEYVKTGDSLDKAGGYGLQTIGHSFVEKITGDLDNAIGLPIRVVKLLTNQFVD